MKNIYKQGRRREYTICYQLKALGYDIIQRTAGSRSPFDVIAISFKDKVIKLIQVKKGLISDNKRSKILDDNIQLNDEFMVNFEVW